MDWQKIGSAGKWEADDTLAKRDIGEHLVGQQGGGFCHAACVTAWAEAPLLTGKRHQPLEVAFVAADPEKAVLKTAALQVGLEFLVYMHGQGFALLGQFVHKGRVVRFWFSPDMTDTQIRVDNRHLREVSHVPKKTVLA